MAHRVTIKITKTDTDQWCFLEPTPEAAIEVARVAEIGFDLSAFVCTPTEATFTKDFDTKFDCNRFLVTLMTANTPALIELSDARHQGWKEEIRVQEI